MTAVVAYHACRREFARQLQSGEILVENWLPSANKYDWLGSGIYFWERSFRRAVEWSREFVKGEAAIVEAEVELGNCLDLTETEFLELIQETYESLVVLYQEEGWRLPENRELPGVKKSQKWFRDKLDSANHWLYPRLAGVDFDRWREAKLRDLDCLVINQFLNLMENGIGDEVVNYQTVRCPFEEGKQLFRGSMIRRQNHIQISVRDNQCIRLLNFREL